VNFSYFRWRIWEGNKEGGGLIKNSQIREYILAMKNLPSQPFPPKTIHPKNPKGGDQVSYYKEIKKQNRCIRH